MENESGQQGFGWRAGQACNLHVTEAVESEARSPLLGSAAPADVGVGGLGGAEIFAIDVSVRLEHFGELQGNGLTASAADLEAT